MLSFENDHTILNRKHSRPYTNRQKGRELGLNPVEDKIHNNFFFKKKESCQQKITDSFK